MADHSFAAFFYGTLMVPKVLHRVCHGSSDPSNPIFATHQFKTYPAILHDYQRYRVRRADYPAILSVKGSTVRGTYVTGLTGMDIARLDMFEGGDYRHETVKVRVLTSMGDESGAGNVESEDEVEAMTYVWEADAKGLEDAEWDFAEFKREKMPRWIGVEGESEYAEVDQAVAAQQQDDGTGGRGANGHITRALLENQKKNELLKNAV